MYCLKVMFDVFTKDYTVYMENASFSILWVPDMQKIKIFWGSAPDPAGELTALPQTL